MRNVIITYRRLLVVLVHLALWITAFWAAFLLRFEFDIPAVYFRLAPKWLAILLALRVAVFWQTGLFHGLWRYSSLRDLISLFKASAISTALFVVVVYFFGPKGFPRSVFVLEWVFSIMVVGGLRFGIRTVREVAAQNAGPKSGEPRRRVLVIGAGDAGEVLMREIVRTYANRYSPVGFLDDNTAKQGGQIHGVRVLGTTSMVKDVVERERVEEILIAIPTASGSDMRRIVEKCRETTAQLRTLPGMDQLVDGKVTVSQLQEVMIEDLLGRAPVVLDGEAIREFLRGRCVMVTGAGGSIGAELCVQIARFAPTRILLVEQAENSLFHIHRLLVERYPELDVVPCIADICDSKRLDAILASTRPAVIFHAAAHKHVPMMEWNSGEAIKNNVFGTKKLADCAARFGVEKFVMVSTDKAVNPTSVMGVSKRTAEIYLQALSQRSKTQFVTVRFGNVLGSAGSVIPLFKEQIAKGGPITVTDPEMKRYFMTIPEACQLVMQAGAMGTGGEIFLLDMGEPVKIVDLAKDLIRLSGLTPGEDIEIVFTGLRPGEKLFEELTTDGEHVDKTKHPKIFVGKQKVNSLADVERRLDDLHALSDGADAAKVRAAFKRIVPEYEPNGEIEAPEARASRPSADVGSPRISEVEPAVG